MTPRVPVVEQLQTRSDRVSLILSSSRVSSILPRHNRHNGIVNLTELRLRHPLTYEYIK